MGNERSSPRASWIDRLVQNFEPFMEKCARYRVAVPLFAIVGTCYFISRQITRHKSRAVMAFVVTADGYVLIPIRTYPMIPFVRTRSAVTGVVRDEEKPLDEIALQEIDEELGLDIDQQQLKFIGVEEVQQGWATDVIAYCAVHLREHARDLAEVKTRVPGEIWFVEFDSMYCPGDNLSPQCRRGLELLRAQ